MNSKADISSLMAEIPALNNASVIGELAGGPVSETWLLKEGGERMVLRIDKPAVDKVGLNRSAELKVLEAVSGAGIGPPLIWADAESGVLLTGFLEGEVWSESDARNPDQLAKLAITLRNLHALPATAPLFEPGNAALRYATEIGSEQALSLAEKAHALANELASKHPQRCLCHNDLVHMNIIDGNPIRLIDWEYAALGEPFFDLAVVVRHHQLDTEIAFDFLQQYLGRKDPKAEEKLLAYCQLYQWLSTLWYELVNQS
jgi:thiamine kinase